jgi:hypothetical protein
MVAATMVLGSAVYAEDESSKPVVDVERIGETESCLRTRSVRRTKVIDDSTIAFFMRNGDVYVNMMPRTCPQLASAGRFAYEARGGRLCNIDQISVLLRFGGRLEQGFSCRLGDYHLSDEETVALMMETIEQGGRNSAVTAESVELPEEDAEAGDD